MSTPTASNRQEHEMNQPMTTTHERSFHVSQALANHAIEGFHPDAADKRMLSCYIVGAASIEDLLDNARRFAQGTREEIST